MPLLIILSVLILFGYLAWRKSLWGVYAVIFSLPLYFWKFNLLSIPFTALEAMIYILALIFLIKTGLIRLAHLLAKTCVLCSIYVYIRLAQSLGFSSTCTQINKSYKKQLDGSDFFRQKFIANPLLFLGIVLFFSGAIIATIISSDMRVSAGILKGWFFAPFIFFLLFIITVKKIDEMRRALSVLAFSGVLVALVAFIYLFVPEYAGVTYDERLRAFYLSANHLAMYLAPALIIVFGIWYLASSNKKNTFDYLLMFLAILIPFLLTYSYGAWLGVFAAIIFILGADCRLGNKKKSNFIYAAILLVILAGIMFSQANSDKFKNIINFTYPSVSSRAIIWNVAGDILKEHWLLGIGPGTFQDYYMKKQADHPPYPEWAVPQPHNIFLAFWLQTGLLGLIGFLMILVWFFKAGFGILKNNVLIRSDNPRIVIAGIATAVICLAIMMYILVHGLVDTTYWKNDLALIFWLLIGVIYTLKQKQEV